MTNLPDDEEPFAVPPDLVGGFLAASSDGGPIVRSRDVEQRRLLRARVTSWARAHDLLGPDGDLIATSEEGIEVTAPLYAITEQLVTVRAIARAPAPVTISVEPSSQSWTTRLRQAFIDKRSKTGDASFDERFVVHRTDEQVMQQLLDHDLRAQLLAIEGWCVLTYVSGTIELHLDVPRLAGKHVLAAVALVHTLARSRVQTSAYR